VYSAFSEILLLDADNIPVRDPTFLFDSAPYSARGAIFWPDYGAARPTLPTGILSRTHPIWELARVPYRGDREFESGQICVDKRRCFRELVLALWLNQYSDFWYRYLWGDKDTFHLAWRKLGREWAMPDRDPVDLGGLVMGQSDFEGRVLFQHRNGAKWSLDHNPSIPGFLHEELCFEILAELRVSMADWHPTPAWDQDL
jgi:Mannosyltransferase putative